MSEELVVSGIRMDTAELVRAIERAEARIKAMEDEIDRTVSTARRAETAYEGVTSKLVKLAVAYGAFQAARRAGTFLFDTIVEFETLQARLEAVTGSVTAAEQAFNLITDFARSTPFEVSNLTQAFTQLIAVGLRPTEEMLKGIGNFAAAMGEDITTATGAILKAAQGNAEQLRERFFLPVTTDGNKLRITFRGVTHEVQKDFASLVAFFQRLGNETFGDAMERRVQTLGGAISNLKDSSALLALEIGRAGLTGELTELVRVLDQAIQDGDGFAKTMGQALASGVGAATDAITVLIEHLDLIIAAFQTLAAIALAQGIARVTVGLANAAVAAGGLRAALLAAFGGPVGVVMTLAGVIGMLVYQLHRAGEAGEQMAADVEGAARRAVDQISKLPLHMAKALAEAERAGLAALQARRATLEGQIARDDIVGGRASARADGAAWANPRGDQTTAVERAARMDPQAREWAQEQIGILGRVIEERQAAAEAMDAYVEAAENAQRPTGSPSTGGQKSEIQRITEDLREQIVELERGTRAAERYRIANAEGASDTEVRIALDLHDQVAQLEKLAAARERGRELAKQAAQAYAQVNQQLEEEYIRLSQGEAALFEYQLAQRGVMAEDRAAAMAKYRLNEELRRQVEAEEEAVERMRRSAEEHFERIRNASEMLADGFHSAFMDIITETDSVGDAFARMASRILEEMARIAMAQAVLGIFTSVFGGSMGGGQGSGVTGLGNLPGFLFGGGRASGGPVDPSQVYLVGERGPELFVPNAAGNIIPNRGAGAGGGQTVVHQNISVPIAAVDARDMQRALQENGGVIVEIIARAARDSASFRTALLGG